MSDDFIAALGPAGPLHELVTWCLTHRTEADFQLRAGQGRREWATLYLGLTALLNIQHLAGTDHWRLTADKNKYLDPDSSWRTRMPLVSLVAELPAVLAYVNQTARNAHPSFTRAEGPVHAQIASASGRDYWIANREVNVAFHNEATNPANSKQDICKPIEGNIWKTVSELGAEDQVKLLARKPLGTGLDFLGVDSAGRILALEAKPSTASVGIQRGPIQTRFYAELIARWLEDDHAALDRVRAMLRQRTQLGLAPAHGGSLQRRVVPVLAIGPGEVPASTKARSRRVAEALNGLTISELVDPLTIWRLDEHGRLDGDPWL